MHINLPVFNFMSQQYNKEFQIINAQNASGIQIRDTYQQESGDPF